MTRSVILPAVVAAMLTFAALAEDVALCLATADRVVAGEAVDDAAQKAGHEACQRALATTSSVVQKYHLQEADFDIVGRPPKQ